MLPGDSRIRREDAFSSFSQNFAVRTRRFLRQMGYFASTCCRRGPRSCWASIVRFAGLPAQWAPVETSRRRLTSSMQLLEQFRHGPETQSEWNLFLWRVTFPMVALVLFTLLAVLGKFGHRIYSFLVCPVWYFSQFVLVAHPFLLVFKFHETDASIRRRIWQVLAALSIAISAIEWFLSTPPDTTSRSHGVVISASLRARFLRHSWIVANTVFGLIAIIAIPRYFYLQRRMVVRDSYETLNASPSASPLFSPIHSPATTPTGASGPQDPFRDDTLLLPRARALTSPDGGVTSTTPPTSSRGIRSQRTPKSVLVELQRRSRAVFLLSGGCALLVWIAMFSSYNSLKTPDIISKYWFTLYMFSPIVCALLIYVLRGQSLSAHTSSNAASSFNFVVIYSVLIVHLPVFLGHLCFRLFTIIELADPAHPAHAEARGIEFADAGSDADVNFSASTSWMKLGISIVYLLVMQTYFYAMTQVVNAMAEPFAHPSLLYLGQLYYYLFWYVLVGSDTPIDALYWGMLLVNNIHIAFLNTGIYADVKQTSTSCFSTPLFSSNLSMFKGSSMAMCFRSATLTVGNVTATSVAACQSVSGSGRHKKTELKESPRARDLVDPAHTRLFVSSSDPEEAEAEEPGTTIHRASRRHHVDNDATDNRETINSAQVDESGPKRILKSSSIPKSSWSSLLSLPTRSILAFGGGSSTSSGASAGLPSSSATIYFKSCTCPQGRESGEGHSADCSCSQTLPGEHGSSCTESTSRSGSNPPVYRSITSVEQLRPLYFLMKLAEQDNMADTTALILVPSLLTLLAVLEKPSHGFAIIADQLNLWVRCVFMFVARMGGAYLAREIFTYKLRSRLRQQSGRRDRAAEDAVLSSVDGVSTRLWIQRLMLQDFHRHFWYLTIVTIVVTFACFERMEVPARFSLLT